MACLSLSDAEAVEHIAVTTPLIEEARRQLPVLRIAARKPAVREDLAQIIGSRFPIYPQPDYDRAELEAFWQSYADALAGLSAESIEAGMKAWVAKPDSRFLPKPGELRALAGASVTRTARAVNVLSRATERAAEIEAAARAGARDNFALEAVRLKRIAKPPEDRDAVAAMAAEHLESHRQRLAAKRIADRGEVRPTHGELAPGHHVTAESLAYILGKPLAEVKAQLRLDQEAADQAYADDEAQEPSETFL